MRSCFLIGVFAGLLAGCGTTTSSKSSAAGASNNAANLANPSADRPVAYVNDAPVRASDLQPALYEAAGGQILAEHLLDEQIQRRLELAGRRVTDALIEAERRYLLQGLDADDENQAVRLLRELRKRRGLGEQRFAALLRRNAGLRLLVRDEATVSDFAVRQAYEMQYGKKYQVRLIVVDTAALAADLVRRARAGESFIDLAVAHSTDPSRAQGGLLPRLSPADPTWPSGVRKAVPNLQPGQISDPIALDAGFAVLKLEQVIPGQAVTLAAVRDALAARVRRSVERVAMQRLARTLLDSLDVLITNRALKASWDEQREQFEAQ